MGFGIVQLPTLLACAGSIEIAEGDMMHTIRVLVPPECMLERQLRLAIRVCRYCRIRLLDRLLCRLAVDSGGRREDDLLHLAVAHGVEQ